MPKARKNDDSKVALKEIRSTLGDIGPLQNERGILHTLYMYSRVLDYGLVGEIAQVFTKDAILEVHGPPPYASRRHEGREALRQFIADYAKSPPENKKHLVVEPVITVRGNTATVETFWASLYAKSGGRPYVNAFGNYLDTMVKQAGTWRIKHRIATAEAILPAKR